MTFLRTLRRPAIENCSACAQQSSSPSRGQEQMPDNFTYNDGEGQRDTVRIQGPLSEAFRQALQIKFESTGISNLGDAVDVDRTFDKVDEVEDALAGTTAKRTPATESQAQDAHVDQILAEIANTPGADVVLPHFNYQVVADHTAKFIGGNPDTMTEINAANKKIEQKDIPGGVIPLFVADFEKLEDVRTIQQAHDTPMNILVITDQTQKPAAGDYYGSNDMSFAMVDSGGKVVIDDKENRNQIDEGDIHLVSAVDRIAALESIYRNSGSRLYFGLESLVQDFKGRLMARPKKDA